jgi:hypothetical protein
VLKHFKSLNPEPKNKENSPSKPRRKASLPEEIAELKKSTASDEDDDLDKYREADLAPLDPVMEAGGNAGDLIIASPRPGKSRRMEEEKQQKDYIDKSLDEIAAEFFQEQYGAAASERDYQQSPRMLPPPESADEKDKHGDLVPDQALSDTHDGLASETDGNPTIVKVIGMIPGALFWSAAWAGAYYSNKAYDSVLDKFQGLNIGAKDQVAKKEDA